MKTLSPLLPLVLAAGICSCNDNDTAGFADSKIEFKNKSVTPALVKTMPGFDNVDVFTLISSADTLKESPSFVFGAQPDGAGLLKNPNGEGYILINNHEIQRSVSRVFLDNTFRPTRGEYIVNARGGVWRLCSATMATPEEHGFGPLFLTAGETDSESQVHGIDPLAPADPNNDKRLLPAMGKAVMENAVPLNKNAYPGKTVVIIGEDNSNGQVILYVSNTVGDLANGKMYMLRRTNQDPVETNMAVGTAYDVEFVEVPNAKNMTGVEIAAQSVTNKALQLARVEDLDYRKGSAAASREIYFVSTGVANQTGKTMWGRLYKLMLDASDPLKGKLTPVADGGINPGNDLINPDNVCATENFVYVQEDGDSFYPGAQHDSWVWQYNISTGQYKPFITMHHRRDDATFNSNDPVKGYNQSGNNNKFGSWEYGAMFDISKEIGSNSSVFLLNIHPHTWQWDRFLNADGTTVSNNKEGGQVVILRNVPR